MSTSKEWVEGFSAGNSRFPADNPYSRADVSRWNEWENGARAGRKELEPNILKEEKDVDETSGVRWWMML